MTAASHTSKVIIVGMVDTTLVQDPNAKRDKETGRRQMIEKTLVESRRRGLGGTREQLAIQTRSPYGGMFQMKLDMEPDIPGAELLESAERDAMLAFEGTLQLKQTFDTRFARDEQNVRGRLDQGRPTRTLQILVNAVRQPTIEEQRASSAVWIEGTVQEPPQVSRHPELPTVQLAGTIARTTLARPADFPGVNASIMEQVDINVAVSTASADAERLYNKGNIVRIAGQLDCRMERQGGTSVMIKLEQIDGEWEAQKIALAAKPSELRAAERRYRNLRSRFEEAPRLYVLALAVELIAGEPAPLADTYQARREFVREQRESRDRRQQQRETDQARRAARKAATGSTVESVGEMPTIAQPEAVETVTALRPRPRRKAEAAEPSEMIEIRFFGNSRDNGQLEAIPTLVAG